MTARPSFLDRASSRAFEAIVWVMRRLPYATRVRTMGWLFSHVVAPIAGWRARIRENLALALPRLPDDKVHRLTRAVPNNVGRSLIEIYSGREFTDRVTATDPLTGPGVPALEEAVAAGRPVIVACAHMGNYDAMRSGLAGRGWNVGALYRPMNNRAFNEHYLPAIHAVAGPLFDRKDKAGLAKMVRFLRSGGILCLGFDQFDRHGATLSMFGLPTETVLTPAQLALRYDALLIPVAGVRQPDGLSFKVEVGEPIPHSTPEAMMQALNDDLQRQILTHPDQWFWVHRRWKPLPPGRSERIERSIAPGPTL